MFHGIGNILKWLSTNSKTKKCTKFKMAIKMAGILNC